MGLDEHADLGTFFLRLGLGAYLLWSGGVLLWSPDLRAGMAAALARTPLIAPQAASQAVMILITIYVLLGALVALGLFTRAAGLIVALLSLAIMTGLHWQLTPAMIGTLGLWSMGKELVVLFAGVSLFFTGCRKLGVDCIMME